MQICQGIDVTTQSKGVISSSLNGISTTNYTMTQVTCGLTSPGTFSLNTGPIPVTPVSSKPKFKQIFAFMLVMFLVY